MIKPVLFDTEGTLRNFISSYEIEDKEQPGIVLVESIANSIDAQATGINIKLEKHGGSYLLRVFDDGRGMDRKTLENSYHKFSSSSKTIGEGIGFAGVGAKLALYFDKDSKIRTTTKTKDESAILCTLMKWNPNKS